MGGREELDTGLALDFSESTASGLCLLLMEPLMSLCLLLMEPLTSLEERCASDAPLCEEEVAAPTDVWALWTWLCMRTCSTATGFDTQEAPVRLGEEMRA